LQTVLKSDQFIKGRPASFYMHTNPTYVIQVAYETDRFEKPASLTACSLTWS